MVFEIKSAKDRIFCHFKPLFALLPPPNNPKNQNLKKRKKEPGDLSLYTCVP